MSDRQLHGDLEDEEFNEIFEDDEDEDELDEDDFCFDCGNDLDFGHQDWCPRYHDDDEDDDFIDASLDTDEDEG